MVEMLTSPLFWAFAAYGVVCVAMGYGCRRK